MKSVLISVFAALALLGTSESLTISNKDGNFKSDKRSNF